MKFPLLSLSIKSLANRKFSVLLTVFSIALSVMLFLGVEKIREGARAGFEKTVSGTDLIVGARTGQTNLLLYSVFRIGEGISGVSWESYETLASRREVAWTIPLSLGDSHKGFRVVGTTNNYFEHYRYGESRNLQFSAGAEFTSETDVVLGATVAKQLNYVLGDKIRISHGLVSTAFAEHDEIEFIITGILEPTGTPVDMSVHVTLEGLELAHEDASTHAEHADDDHAHEPEQISAFMMGLTSRPLALRLQQQINTYEGEPLTAILPGVTLAQLWGLIGTVETALLAISGFVVVIGLVGLMTGILAGLNERRREMAILRALGSRPGHVFTLLLMEAIVTGLAGALLGMALLYGGFALAGIFSESLPALPLLDTIITQRPGLVDLIVIAAVVVGAAIIAMIPAWRAYRNSLSDGLTIRT